eukprot:TRINITY_DN3967_c0_g1_i1.p1 TRINITY_DN3967_c0_g1~~TRINITY_DN3967_c0_g1_i1.p1  ORF type:complete len:177 (+),score=67.96 TRINITY_DN3967_c0_g1_i1:454-984(+)
MASVAPYDDSKVTGGKRADKGDKKKLPKDKNKQAAAADDADKELVIPKSLKILPTDSEEVRAVKKRKIHAIKSQHRLKQSESERNARQSGWQQFQASAAKKTKVGFFTGRQKDSIFRSPDSVAGRVGVTGSGNTVTQQPMFKPKEVERVKQGPSLTAAELSTAIIPEPYRLPDTFL